MKCVAKKCEREAPAGHSICEPCAIELEVLMKGRMSEHLGRWPTDAEFEIFLDRLMAKAPKKARTR